MPLPYFLWSRKRKRAHNAAYEAAKLEAEQAYRQRLEDHRAEYKRRVDALEKQKRVRKVAYSEFYDVCPGHEYRIWKDQEDDGFYHSYSPNRGAWRSFEKCIFCEHQRHVPD